LIKSPLPLKPLKLPSVEEIKKYSSLNVYFEVWGRLYTTCQNCGEPIMLDTISKTKLILEKNKRILFCGGDCCAKTK
jgi:hypothetical protein